MIYIFLALQIAAAPPNLPPLLAEWNGCMLDYAQVEGAGMASDITIALHGLDLCLPEKQRYAVALQVKFEAAGASKSDASVKAESQAGEDQRTIVLRSIAYLRRMREK